MMDSRWIVSEIDGKIASISTNYTHFALAAREIARLSASSIGEVRTYKISTEELLELGEKLRWEDLRLFGSKFQLKVWRCLYDLTHTEGLAPRLYSYTDIAALVGTPSGVRAVAHAAALNPVAFVIPCHLVVPKESMDKIKTIRQSAENTLFKGTDLYLIDSVDVGEYAHGAALKRELIRRQLAR